MQQSSEVKARPRIGRTLTTLAAALLCATVLSQPNPAYAGPHGGEAAVKSTKSATMKSTTVEAPAAATAVETSTPASPMWPSVGKIWLTERGGAQHSRCDGQNPSVLRPGFNFA